ncbi:MAG TPA: oligosaccharide flippase family protein [Bacteroidales bacterium]|nr:oligosaccharide flippase family protein [Bacteroidales bacterium]HQL70657.1 oligosaccharide flippase family protein [Bacteroidales bacterium]
MLGLRKHKVLVQSAGIYTLANFLNAAIPFLLLPFLTNHLSPADYGIVAMFQVLMQFTTPFVGMNSTSAITRQYYDRDKIDFRQYVSDSFFITMVTGIFITLLFVAFKSPLSAVTQFPENWLFVVVIYCLAQNIGLIVLSLWQVQYKPVPYGLFRIGRTILDISFSVGLILWVGMRWEGMVIGQTTATLLQAALALFFLLKGKWLRKGINKEYIKDALKFGVPLIPHVIGAIIITYSDRLFITNMVSIAETGLYSVGYNVGMIVYLVQNSFNQAWVPWFYEKLKGDRHSDKLNIVKFTYLYYLAMGLLVAVVTLGTPWFFTTFLGQNFQNAMQYVFWIALGFGFNGMYKMVVNYIFYLKKTYIISIMTVVTAVINILLNYFFIRSMGAIGAAKATAVSFFIEFVVVWIISSRLYKMPWLMQKAK